MLQDSGMGAKLELQMQDFSAVGHGSFVSAREAHFLLQVAPPLRGSVQKH